MEEDRVISPGHRACPGCGAVITARYVLEVLGKDTILIIPACCWSIIGGPYPYTPIKDAAVIHCLFPAAGAAATGIKRALIAQGNTSTQVVGLGGDGGTFDIGLQCLSGAAERNEDIIYVCYDNEAYMNTGVQRSSATPMGAVTTTTPYPEFEKRPKKNMIEVMAAHKIPYAATGSVAFPDDLKEKITKAKDIRGFRFLHVFSPCPTGWGCETKDSIKIARLAVRTGIFPLLEVENGVKRTINFQPTPRMPVGEYLKLQKRFKDLTKEDIEYIQSYVDSEWERLTS